MDKDFLKFYNGENNYYRSGNLSIGREPLPNSGRVYYIIKHDDKETEYTLHEFWTSKLGQKLNMNKKSTGGKKPYVMLMTEALYNTNITPTNIGYLIKLTHNIEWGTGRLIDRKTKKPLTGDSIASVLGTSSSTVDKLIKDLKQNNAIRKESDGYFISTELFKKGGTK